MQEWVRTPFLFFPKGATRQRLLNNLYPMDITNVQPDDLLDPLLLEGDAISSPVEENKMA